MVDTNKESLFWANGGVGLSGPGNHKLGGGVPVCKKDIWERGDIGRDGSKQKILGMGGAPLNTTIDHSGKHFSP